MGAFDWIKGGARRGASIAFADEFAELKQQLAEVREDHKMMLHRIEQNERRLEELDRRFYEVTITALRSMVDTAKQMDAAERSKEIPPPEHEE
ncbi:MAG: hypothetical protein AAGI91_16020 [Bacteroidota bacterium]